MARRTSNRVARSKGDPRLDARLHAFMDQRGLRSTAQRRVVTEVFFASREHLSVEELVARVRKKNPRVGPATVYRTLRLLKDSGLATERDFGDGLSRYEVARDDETHHDHLICTGCGAIEEFEEPEIEALQERVARAHGFTLTRHEHELYGLCRECQTRNAR